MVSFRPTADPNESDIERGLRWLIEALRNETTYSDDGAHQIVRRYIGRQLVRDDGEQQVLPIGKVEDVVETPDDILRFWTARVLREAIANENLTTIGLNDIVFTLGAADEDDWFVIRDTSDSDRWKIISVGDVRELVLSGDRRIGINGTGGASLSYDTVNNTLIVDGSNLRDSWFAFIGGNPDKTDLHLKLMTKLLTLSDATLDNLIGIARRI